MNIKKCNVCCRDGSVIGSKFRTVVLWLMVLFLTTLFTLLFIMCFIHFLKNNHSPPIVPNDLQDYSTTKSIYFLLSFYFLLWTVVYFGCTISTVIPRRAEHLHPHPHHHHHHHHHASSDKPGKALLIVLLILLAIITMLLCTIDRVYSPWIMNFLNGKIFSYCVQVSALVTLTVAICYIFAIATRTVCSSKKAGAGATISGGQQRHHLTIREDDGANNSKSSFANPCYNVEFSISDELVLEGNGEGVTTRV